MSDAPPTRSKLLSLLTQACELEHGLACSYLFTAMSLRQELTEGLSWQDQQHTRFWAAQIYFVAAQEMLHLAQAWNLLAAIGGTPYYLRPNFPQPARFYPLNLPIGAEPFSLGTLDRFIAFERPASKEPPPGAGALPFGTVAELYGRIREAFASIDPATLFIGFPGRQVGPELVDFPQLVKVTDRDSALAAVDLILHQGEGTAEDRADCHWGVFRGIRRQYLAALEEAEKKEHDFDVVRPVLSNPVAAQAVDWVGEGANVIADQRTSEVADCFDSIYGLMLRMLQYVFDNGTGAQPLLKLFGGTAIEVMATVIKPLGEALTLLPAGEGYQDQTAGPGFVLSRHVPLPAEPHAALVVACEKLADLDARLSAAVAAGPPPDRLLAAQAGLRRVAAKLAQATID
jgi:hypothetical protein